MTIADCLARLSPAEIGMYAVTAGVPLNAKVSAVAAALAAPGRVADELASLPPARRDALILLVVGFEGRADRNELVRELGRMHPTSAGDAVAGLERQGFLVPRAVSPWLSALVEDVVPAVRQAVFAWLAAAADPWVAEVEGSRTPDPYPAVADTARLLAVLADGVRVRQEGGVYQADQRRLAQVIDHSRPRLPEPVIRSWGGYENEILALHLALAIQLDLVAADAHGWHAAPEAEAWVDLPAAEQWRSLVRAWFDIGAARLQGRFADLLSAFLDGSWVDLDRWRGHLGRYVHTYPPLPAASEALLLRPGLLLGAVGVGKTGDRTVFRLSAQAVAAIAGDPVPDWPDPLERTVVDADFEVMVPPGAPARLVWDLERWAHRVRVDRVARYRITRETVQRRSRTGEPAAAWLDRLGEATRFGVPENVRFAVTEWAVPARRAVMRPAVAVRFPAGAPEGWSPPAGAQPAGPGCWLLDFPDAVKEAGALRRRGVVVDGVPEEWTAMERARGEQRRRTGQLPLSLPWPGPHTGDPRTPFGPREAGEAEG